MAAAETTPLRASPIPEGRTPRLLLKPLSLADAPQIQALFPRWEIVRYLANRVPWPYPPDGAEQFLREVALPQMESGEGLHWTLRRIEAPNLLIGMIGLFKSEEENRGFWLDPQWQKQGLMSEACVWANDFYFNQLGFERMRVPKAAVNLASRRISERQGMRLVAVGEKDYVCGRLPSEIWEITAEEWRQWKLSHSESNIT
jgi:RimJ/RimL family protein N-acetyltransferase